MKVVKQRLRKAEEEERALMQESMKERGQIGMEHCHSPGVLR